MSSLDDFYTTSHGLIVMETTNAFYNDTMYKDVIPESLFTGERAMICNRISNSSKEWAENFKKYNSGTYNNQFMILDKNKVNLVNKTIDLDAFYIVETLPGLAKSHNVTDFLKFGYWSSFNVPFDKEIYKKSNIQNIIDERPAIASSLDYDNCARTKIFRREQSSADTLEGFMSLMRFNKYKRDPYSEGNPSLSIASRADLNGQCSGAYDSKVGVLSEYGINGKMKIHMIKKQTGDIRKENGLLNMKTLELKKQYNNLIEADAALRTENDELRREKHELILKKNELGFYISEPKSYDSVREVNIPIDGKRRRPTNVSKKEKQFGGGYTSSLGYKSTSKDAKYTSTYANNYGIK
jgi:hypothetical protein